MRYRAALTIPAGTPVSTPATAVLSLCPGFITEIELLFPSGQAGLTYLQIWHHERQVFPSTAGQAFRGDDHLLAFNEHFSVSGIPHEIELRGWAPDTTLEHTVYVDVTVEAPPDIQVGGFTYVALPEGV